MFADRQVIIDADEGHVIRNLDASSRCTAQSDRSDMVVCRKNAQGLRQRLKPGAEAGTVGIVARTDVFHAENMIFTPVQPNHFRKRLASLTTP